MRRFAKIMTNMTTANAWRNLQLLFLIFIVGCEHTPMAPPGGGPEPIPLPAYFDYPAWHPGGRWIAVEHADSLDTNGDGRRDRWFGGVWLVHAETGQKQHLIDGFNLPAWSPDGRKFVFLYWDFLKDRPGNGELWLINIDGTGLRRLTYFRKNSS